MLLLGNVMDPVRNVPNMEGRRAESSSREMSLERRRDVRNNCDVTPGERRSHKSLGRERTGVPDLAEWSGEAMFSPG